MPTAEKVTLVEEYGSKLGQAKSLLLADFTGMDVETVTRLRRDLRRQGVEYRVLKNTLLKLACRRTGMAALEPFLEGPTAIAYSVEDEVSPARALVTFAKQHERPVVKAGMIGERFYSKEELIQLAALPPRDILLGQVIGTIVAPLSSFLGAVDVLLASPAALADSLSRKQSA
jgi:large subunit ribosomal protein L10